MVRVALFVAAVVAAASLGAQPARLTGADLDAALAFDGPVERNMPRGWGGGPPDTLSVDREAPHSGTAAARIDRAADRTDQFSAFTTSIPIDFTGTKIELRGFLRTKDVGGGFAGFWLREDGAGGTLQFDNMQQRQIDGTRDWTEYRIELPLAPAARQLFLGFLLSGHGTVWADDIRILVDGKPLADAPRVVRAPTILEKDQEFARGSRIAPQTLSAQQIENLAVLGRVWGFLKYHHPRVATGELHWDFELFRVMPAVLAAPDAATRNEVLLEWGKRIGDAPACKRCAVEPSRDAQLRSDIEWIRDTAMLGGGLSSYLTNVHRDRFAAGDQFYLSAAPGVGNPQFDNELSYASVQFPDEGYQLLALFRYWNMIEYWFPNRDVIGEPWPDVLREFVPLFAAAGTRDDYALALAKLIARINDSHASLGGGGADLLPPRGMCQLPVALRFIEGAPTVAGYSNAQKGPASGLQVGDVLVEIGSARVDAQVEEWLPFYSGSNRPAKLATLARTLSRGDCGPVDLLVARGEERVRLTVERLPRAEIDLRALATHDRPGETFQILPGNVGYLKLSSIRAADVASYIERAQGGHGLIVDIRNYPSEFVVFALGGHLVSEPTPFVHFSAADVGNPGTFVWIGKPLLQPAAPRYAGKVAILVDDATISQAEYTALALRATPNAVVIGGTTLGADGNVSQLSLPGGYGSTISGLGVFYPDHAPTQRVGIVPDIIVTPTVAGVRSGRDEILDRAVRELAE